jgi:thiol-disulfide isomerase/thioredoxin
MRTLVWTSLLTLLFVPLVSAQDLEQLQKTINTNMPLLPKLADVGRKAPTPEIIAASKALFDAATQIYALPDLAAGDKQWTLPREAAALVVLAYSDAPTYYHRLVVVSDELEKRGLKNIAKEIEKHVILIGIDLATKTGNVPLKINADVLADKMVLYALRYPSTEATSYIDLFLSRTRGIQNLVHRDARLAKTTPIFYQYYKDSNYAPKAKALEPDMNRSTLAGQFMFLDGVDINGKDFDYTSIKDKVVLIQFWGTWCVNCMKEMPELIALHEKYHARGLEIIGVNTGTSGDNPAMVKRWVETKEFNGKKIPWTILHEGLARSKNKEIVLTDFYGITELPVMILVGRNEKVLDLHPLPSTLDDRIAYAVSTQATVDAELTDEDRKRRDAIRREQEKAEDEKIKADLAKPQ